jgi:hypothetical protein
LYAAQDITRKGDLFESEKGWQGKALVGGLAPTGH